jgi:deoxyribose-phosphate aldolase
MADIHIQAPRPDHTLMREHSAPAVKIKAAGGVRTLSDLLRYKEIGISRCGATATAAMLEEAGKLFGDQ